MPKKKETRGRKPIYATKEEARLAVQKQRAESKKKTCKVIVFRFHNENDKEIIDKLKSSGNKNDYVRRLIMADIGIEEL